MTAPKPTQRQKKTPQQRAEEALATANRLVDRLTVRRDTTRRDALAAEGALTDANRRRDHLAQHPDLPTTQTGADA